VQVDMQRVEYTWEAREVVRELNDRPHHLLRVEIKGGPFPQRALEPVARITSHGGDQSASWFATISDDGQSLSAYFPLDVPEEGTLEIGYFPVITARLAKPFERALVVKLDPSRLGPDVITVTRGYLKERGIVR
jgi:hypothetical protein